MRRRTCGPKCTSRSRPTLVHKARSSQRYDGLRHTPFLAIPIVSPSAVGWLGCVIASSEQPRRPPPGERYLNTGGMRVEDIGTTGGGLSSKNVFHLGWAVLGSLAALGWKDSQATWNGGYVQTTGVVRRQKHTTSPHSRNAKAINIRMLNGPYVCVPQVIMLTIGKCDGL